MCYADQHCFVIFFSFVGILSAAVDVAELDINQCDLKDGEEHGDSNQLRGFAGSHKCHVATSKVKNTSVFFNALPSLRIAFSPPPPGFFGG